MDWLSTAPRLARLSDAGETARTIGYLLAWMAEQTDVFVCATANDVRQLAPEQIRRQIGIRSPVTRIRVSAMTGVGFSSALASNHLDQKSH